VASSNVKIRKIRLPNGLLGLALETYYVANREPSRDLASRGMGSNLGAVSRKPPFQR